MGRRILILTSRTEATQYPRLPERWLEGQVQEKLKTQDSLPKTNHLTVLSYMIYITAITGGLFGIVVFTRRTLSGHRAVPKGFFWMACYLLLCGLVQWGGRYVTAHYGTNVPWYNFFGLFYYLLIFLVFYHLKEHKGYRKVMVIIFGLWCIPFLIAYRPALEGLFASQSIVVMNLAVITACLVYFYHMLMRPDSEKSPSAQGDFLIVMAMFFYFLSSFMRWLAESAFSDPSDTLAMILGNLNSSLVLAFYLFVCWAFWVQWKGMKMTQS